MSTLQNLSVIVVGAGFAGLAVAIELRNRGAKVKVFEALSDFSRQGDVISMPACGVRTIAKWGTVYESFIKNSSIFNSVDIHDKTGKLLLTQDLPTEFDGYPAVFTGRGYLHRLIYDYAISLGVEVVMGTPISRYFEEDACAGVIVGNTRHSADLVLAADGVRTHTAAVISGKERNAIKSGVAIYRSWFQWDVLKGNPLTEDITQATECGFKVWIGDGRHAIVTYNPIVKHVACFMTHEDLADIDEGWDTDQSKDAFLKDADGWDERLRQVIRSIPDGNLIDYKILWRDPVREWVSKKGRIAVLGDAAHPHLASAATGGAQAFEDAVTIATLLERTGTDKVPLALKAYEVLRFERTSLTQRLGWETRHRWNYTDWDAVAKDNTYLKYAQPEWLQCHDALKYANDKYDEVISHLQHGTPFQSTNVPQGYVHEDWTLDDMIRLEKERVSGESFYKASL